MSKLAILLAMGLFAATNAEATCPAKAPSQSKVTLAAGDQRVNGAFLKKTLEGRRLVFTGGTETYRSDGTYRYKDSSGTYDAPSYRFYDNGFRCIGYSNPRFDYYVVNNNQLVLINGNGARFVGKLAR